MSGPGQYLPDPTEGITDPKICLKPRSFDAAATSHIVLVRDVRQVVLSQPDRHTRILA